MISKIEVSVQQVMHSFNVVTCFNVDHIRVFLEQVHPFLRIPVVLNKILADEGVPAIALVQVKPLIKPGLFDGISGQAFGEELLDAGLVFFVACVAVFHVPAVQLQGEVRKLYDHFPPLVHFICFDGQPVDVLFITAGDIKRLDLILERDHLDKY